MLLIVSLLAVAVALAFYYVRHAYTYWQRRNFPYDQESKFPYGCLEKVIKREKSMGLAIHDVYLRHPSKPFLGIYLFWRPSIVVRDVDLARKVLAQDFASFHDRGVYVDEENDPLSANLFSMKGQSWRNMRTKLAPSFTSGKLKAMFGTSNDVGGKMVAHLETIIPENGSVEFDFKELMTDYAIDIIASVIFGLEVNSFENSNNEVRRIVDEARQNDFINAFVGTLVFLCPSLVKYFVKIGMRNKTAVRLRDVIKETIEHREKNNIVRKDLLQLLMQLRNKGEINENDNNWDAKSVAGQVKTMSIDHIAAHLFIFYIAGQETTASSAAFTIYELSQYPELLKRAQAEVEEVMKKHGGVMSYEALKDMDFVERCVNETIRKYPGLPFLNRQCTQDYRIPDSNKVIEKDTSVIIPLFGIHRDPKNFPDPMRYDPDRFLESSRNYNPNAFMPFGEGPRHCIAQRMGMMNSKLAVVKILQNFNIEIQGKREIEFDNFSIALLPKGGVNVRLSRKRKD